MKNLFKTAFKATALLFAAAVLVSCSSKKDESGDYNVTVSTYDGANIVEQTYENKPERIVCNNVSSAEILCALGLEDKIVGMYNPDDTVTSEYAEKISNIRKLGDKKTISNEVILGVEPDIIVGRTGTAGTVKAWNDLGVMCYFQKASAQIEQSISNVVDDVLAFGKIFDVEEKAETYASSLNSKIKTVTDSVNKDTKDKAILMCNFSGNSYGVFKSNFQEAMLNIIGLTNSASSGNSFSLENLIETNPKVIIYVKATRNSANDATALEKLKSTTAISEVDAIKNDKIIVVTYVAMMDYGPEQINTILSIYQSLYEVK